MDSIRARWAERENVQKRTFTRWINLHLEKRSPPLEVDDLFVDIQDGKILMALLEVLTGQSLLQEYKSSTHRIFRLNNIAKALKFLEDSNVKLVSIDAAEIADGNPSLVLGLIWNIILFLQIKELTGNLNRMLSSSSLSSLPGANESDASQPEKSLSVSMKDQRKAIKALLSWVQQRTRKYGVAVQDFGGSWKSGLAFLAVIKAIDSSLVDMKKALERSPRENLEDAFTIAQERLNIPRLLEPEDVMVDSPDEHSIMTYVTQFLEHFPELDPDDFTQYSEDPPVEMTYVRYKDGPKEEEGKIITLPKSQDAEFMVELQTRPLTPPETHFYTEVNVGDDSSSRHDPGNPRWISPDTSQAPAPKSAAFTLGKLQRRPATTSPTSEESREIPSNGFHQITREEPLLLSNGRGGDPRDNLDDNSPRPTLGGPKDLESKYILSDHYNKYCDSSSSFSSISDREQNDLFYPSEDSLGSVKPSPLSDDSGLVTPHDQTEMDEPFEYVFHLPKDHEDSKPRTVFQAYKAGSGEKSASRNHLDEEADAADEKGSAKVSIIPHDLFYFPHYSVPIADVLKAFADNGPDNAVRTDAEYDDSSVMRSEDSISFSGEEDHFDGERQEKMASVPENEEWRLGSQDYVEGVRYTETGSQDYAEGVRYTETGSQDYVEGVRYTETGSPHRSMLNGSASQAIYRLPANNMASPSGYRDNYQVTESSGGPDGEREESTRSKHILIGGRSHLEEEFHLMEDRAAKLAAEVEASLKDPWFPSDGQNGLQARHRPAHQPHTPLNFGTSREENTNGYKDQHSGQSEPGAAQHTSSLAHGTLLPAGDSRKIYYIGLLLWFICYCIFILPEFDIDKVEFLVRDE